MEQLVAYDRHLVVGILGGSSGTTFDAFHQLWEAKKYGARVALYGRMINNSEHQSSFIRHLRLLADGEINDPAEAVRSYHAALAKRKIMPYRSLEDDLASTLRQSAYGSKSGTTESKNTSNLKSASGIVSSTDKAATHEETPDFSAMSQQEKLDWNRRRLDRTLGI